MRSLAGLALDMCIRLETSLLADVVLKAGPELAEVMPTTCNSRPILAERARKSRREFADPFQMLDQVMGLPPYAGSIHRDVRNWSPFPHFTTIVGRCLTTRDDHRTHEAANAALACNWRLSALAEQIRTPNDLAF